MAELPPQQLADMWYLKFGYEWVTRGTLDSDWRSIVSTLMKTNKVEYTVIPVESSTFEEIYKLKESHANH